MSVCVCVCLCVYTYSLAQKVCAYLDKCKDFRSIKNEVVYTEYAFLNTRKLICGPCQIETHYQWVFVIAYMGKLCTDNKRGCGSGCGLTSNLSSSVLRSL